MAKFIKNFVLFLLLVALTGCSALSQKENSDKSIENIVNQHARTWETGDYKLLDLILHKDLVFAYPGRRLNKTEALKDFIEYNASFKDTKIYINKIIVDGDYLAVEWQFASTNKKTGNRTAVSDAIIGKVKDGKIIVWKEYLDGRVSRMQIAGNLSLEEGQEPFPWPRKK